MPWARSRAHDFESTRCATRRKNSNLFEIYGDKRAVAFSLERMNELACFGAAIRVFLLKSAGRGILHRTAVRPFGPPPPADRSPAFEPDGPRFENSHSMGLFESATRVTLLGNAFPWVTRLTCIACVPRCRWFCW